MHALIACARRALPLRSSALRTPMRRRMFSWQQRPVEALLERPIHALIGLNVGVWALWQAAGNNREAEQWMAAHFTTSTAGLVNGLRFHTLVTSSFSHRDFSHLAVNMITLYFFGGEVLALLGAQRLLSLYIGSAVASGVVQAAWPLLSDRISPYTPALGASGAVSSVVMWSILTYPRRIILLYFIIPVPAALFGAGFILKDSLGLFGYGSANVGNAAHIGGAMCGAMYFLLTRRRPPQF